LRVGGTIDREREKEREGRGTKGLVLDTLDSPVFLRKLVYILSLDHLPLITSSGRSGLKRSSSSSSLLEFGRVGRVGEAIRGTYNVARDRIKSGQFDSSKLKKYGQDHTASL